MKQKKYFILAAAAALFAACSSDDLALQEPAAQPAQQNAVSFDAYTYRATTRAGQPGMLTDYSIKLDAYNFGVFAFYTDNNYYDQQAKPNFMYNEHVTYVSGTSSWVYSPLKYWPNEYGSTAISDDADKISFFAYAPYVDVNAATGKPVDNTTNPFGIQSLTSNTTSGDPIVKYQGTFATNMGVDLCWGVCNQDVWPLVEKGQNQTSLEEGKPWLDVQRPADPTANQKLKFTFKHATAKLNVQIDHFTDGYTNGIKLDNKTRIYVRSITFTGFAREGALNLNNTDANKPLWLSYCCDTEISGGEEVTIYDGRKEGKEGMAGATASNEKVQGLNVPLIQTEAAFTPTPWQDAPSGVIETPQNLFAKWVNNAWAQETDPNAPIYVIPTDDDVEVEIVYDVETIDDKLAGYLSDGKTHGSTIQNRIHKAINFGSLTKLEAGKAYIIQLHLGMNSVKFDAEVTDWEKVEPATDIDLPANMPQFAATGTPHTAHTPGSAKTYTFAITGLTGGEILTNAASGAFAGATVEVNSTSAFSGTGDKRANPSGVAYIKVSGITPYTKVIDQVTPGTITLTRSDGTSTVVVNVTQLAEKLGMAKPDPISATNTYALKRNITGSAEAWNDAATKCPELKAYPGTDNNNYIRVWLNGAELVKADTPSADNNFSFDNTTGTITLKNATSTGDVIKVTIKCGNVPEETISFTI